MPAAHRRRKRKECGNVRVVFLVLVVLLIGCGVTALWLYREGKSSSGIGHSSTKSNSTHILSEGTLKVLTRVTSPVEIRFYSLLDPASISDSLKSFSARVDQLITAYERQTNGNIQVSRRTGASDADASAASADGIKPFNLDRGDACYLGITVASGGRKESLPKLDPDWEAALESDLTRAITRVIDTPAKAASATVSQKLDPAITEEVKRVIPNVESVSLEEGKNTLREAALREFADAAREMEAKIKNAQQRVKLAQSPAEKETAIKNLHEVQSEQAEKLKAIAAKSEAQIHTLQLLKQGSH
jgi:hypothetical protein